MTTRLDQIKDTPIKLSYYPAFADLVLEVETKQGPARISLDVEMFEEALEDLSSVYAQAHGRPLVQPAQRVSLEQPTREDPGLQAMVYGILGVMVFVLVFMTVVTFK